MIVWDSAKQSRPRIPPRGPIEMFQKLAVLIVFPLMFAAPLLAQSKESATSGTRRLYVGAEFSTFNPDWGCIDASAFTCWNRHLLGVAALVDANRVVWKLGVEGEARWLHWGGP